MKKETALKILRERHANALFSERIALETLFPELKESEEEKIKNIIKQSLKSYFKGKLSIGTNDVDYAACLTWLEKQGEQKPADKAEPKFKIGDWVVCEVTGSVYQIKNCIENLSNHKYGYDLTNGGYIGTDEVNHYHLWTIQDAKDGDVLVASDGSIFLFKGTIDCACKHYVALATDGVVNFNERLEHYWETSRAVQPATREQQDLLFQKMKEAGYEWDSEKKELKIIDWSKHIKYEPNGTSIIEEKSAWSEDDKEQLDRAIYMMEQLDMTKSWDDVYNWLKSLKDRVLPQLNQELSDDVTVNEYVDLGLPSGTLWKSSNESEEDDDFYTYNKAMQKFGEQLPTKEQWEELKDKCQWTWTGKGYNVTGPNGNFIHLPAAGYRSCGCVVFGSGCYGNYWSSKPIDSLYAWSLNFKSHGVSIVGNRRCFGLSVRLVNSTVH